MEATEEKPDLTSGQLPPGDEDDAQDSSSSDDECADISLSKPHTETTALHNFQDQLREMANSTGHEDPKYELFNIVYLNRNPNYCFKVRALNLTAIGKGWCEEEAFDSCAKALICKFNAAKIKKKSLKMNEVETGMNNLVIDDSESIQKHVSTDRLKQSSVKSEARTPLSHEDTSVVTDKSVTNLKPKKKSKVIKNVGSNKEISTDNAKLEKHLNNIGNMDSNPDIVSGVSDVKHKNNRSKRSIKSKTYYSDAYLELALDTKLLGKIKDSDFGADPIAKLQNICVTSKMPLPRYNFLRPITSENGTIFKMQCSFLGHIVYGRGQTKKCAKSQAAAKMMRNMIALGWQIDVE